MNVNPNGYIPNAEASSIARQILSLIIDKVSMCEIVGSIRRGKEMVKDAEIVILPKPGLLERLDVLVADRKLQKAMYLDKNNHIAPRWGQKYRGVCLPHSLLKVELFFANPHNYGWLMVLRSGPADANEWLMTHLKWRSPFLMHDGYVWQEEGSFIRPDSRKLHVPSEEIFFKLMGIPFVAAHSRTESHYKFLFNRHDHQWGDQYQFVTSETDQPLKQPSLF